MAANYNFGGKAKLKWNRSMVVDRDDFSHGHPVMTRVEYKNIDVVTSLRCEWWFTKWILEAIYENKCEKKTLNLVYLCDYNYTLAPKPDPESGNYLVECFPMSFAVINDEIRASLRVTNVSVLSDPKEIVVDGRKYRLVE